MAAARRSTNVAPWLIGGGILAAVLYMRGRSRKAAFMLGIRVWIADVRLVKGKNVIQIQFRVQNPNSVPITVRSIVGDVFVNNERLGNVSKFGPQVIAGNNESSLFVEIKPKALAIFNTLARVNLEKIKLLIRFVGNINANGKALPMNISYNYQPIPPGTAENVLNLVKEITGKR